jgi:hypothetical protein
MVFEIHDPDHVVVDRNTVELVLPTHGRQPREARINLLHIAWVEVIDRMD